MKALAHAATAGLAVTGALYGGFLIAYAVGLWRLRRGRSDAQPSVSVVVPARDEEENIGACLAALSAQKYPTDRLEIVVVDDRSTDATSDIVSEWAKRDDRIRGIRAPEPPAGVAPKKHAVEVGIEAASGEVIATTDADCVPGSGWVRGLVRHLTPDVGVVVGLTEYDLKGVRWRFLQGMNALDFLTHTFCRAGALGLGWACDANANNFAYRRSAYEAVDGFGEARRLTSGDDAMLMTRIATRTSWRAAFAPEPETFVRTRPEASWRAFWRQRMRWASKGTAYRPSFVIFLTGAFGFFALLSATLPFALAAPRAFSAPLWAWLAKAGVEAFVMGVGAWRFRRFGLLPYFLPAQFLHAPVIVLAVLGGHLTRFEWKGRALGRSVPVAPAGATDTARVDADALSPGT